MKAVREDVALKNFYTRVRKRSSAKIARVAVARKLAEICWKRLRRWQAETPAGRRKQAKLCRAPARPRVARKRGLVGRWLHTVRLIGHCGR